MTKSKWYGKQVSEHVIKAAKRGIYDGIEFWLQESNKIVPHDEGTLERSGTTSMDDQQLMGMVSYDTPYAVRQHEDRHLRHPNGRKAKYLELSGLENKDEITKHIETAIRKALK